MPRLEGISANIRSMAYSTLIEVQQLAAEYSAPDWALFDCRFDLADKDRGERDYRVDHLPDARFAHLERDLSGPVTPTSGRHPLPDPRVLCQWLGDKAVGPETQVIAYDDSGGTMAVRLWWLLRWLGHRAVAVLNGGWQAWCAAGLARRSDIPRLLQGAPYPGNPNPKMLLSSEQILSHLGGERWFLLDARTGERFRGEQEPIDPVAGHVPGARNLPLQSNLGPDGRFLDPQLLGGIYRQALAGRDPRTTACYCGSGVTACHNLLAMELAGIEGARLYAGSWSEWIRDPSRPIAVGKD